MEKIIEKIVEYQFNDLDDVLERKTNSTNPCFEQKIKQEIKEKTNKEMKNEIKESNHDLLNQHVKKKKQTYRSGIDPHENISYFFNSSDHPANSWREYESSNSHSSGIEPTINCNLQGYSPRYRYIPSIYPICSNKYPDNNDLKEEAKFLEEQEEKGKLNQKDSSFKEEEKIKIQKYINHPNLSKNNRDKKECPVCEYEKAKKQPNLESPKGIYLHNSKFDFPAIHNKSNEDIYKPSSSSNKIIKENHDSRYLYIEHANMKNKIDLLENKLENLILEFRSYKSTVESKINKNDTEKIYSIEENMFEATVKN